MLLATMLTIWTARVADTQIDNALLSFPSFLQEELLQSSEREKQIVVQQLESSEREKQTVRQQLQSRHQVRNTISVVHCRISVVTNKNQ